MAAHIARKLLIAEHGQPFLEAKLEPIAAGDAIARPVVEILMRDDRLDPGIIVIGGRVRQGQNIFGVEDIQPLVLHRAHVEIIDRHDIEDIQIIFAAVHLFIPAH